LVSGIGWSIERDVRAALDSRGGLGKVDSGDEEKKSTHVSCAELLSFSEAQLRDDLGLGPKLAAKVFVSLRGLDPRVRGAGSNGLKEFQVRKSIGTDINWGTPSVWLVFLLLLPPTCSDSNSVSKAVRFKSSQECVEFIERLCVEVRRRMLEYGSGNSPEGDAAAPVGLRGRKLQLKIKKRRPGAPRNTEAWSFKGHGIVDNFSRQVDLGVATNDLGVMQRASVRLFREMNIAGEEVRGVGLTMVRLGFFGVFICTQR
jgi:impB/mucB/samB family C-terminal domain